MHAWTESRLLTGLISLLIQKKIPIAICMFIDGLDEFEGRYDLVIEAIINLVNQAHVKVCLFNRPLLDFDRAFGDKSQLRLQNMTFDSIRAYVHDRLFDRIQRRFATDINNHAKAEALLKKIVNRADGVFLWVVIAVRNVRDGLQDFADLDELATAIENIPIGVDDLYTKMLNKIKPAYRRDVARFFQIVLYDSFREYLDLYRFYFINTQKRIFEDLPLDYEKIDQRDVVQSCRDLKIQLISHTAGLLDLTPAKSIVSPYSTQDDYDPILLTRVDFHHRTVRDFLRQNTAAKAYLVDNGMLEQCVRRSIARGTVAHLFHFSQKDGEPLNNYDVFESLLGPLNKIMNETSIVEQLIGAAQGKFLRSLHKYFFIPHHRINADTKINWHFPINFPFVTVSPRCGIDLIGLAANCGMGRYVCELLDLPFVEPAGSSVLRMIHAKTKDEEVVEWVSPMNGQLGPFGYRERLKECLK